MGRKLASKKDKELIDEGQIRERGLNKSDFSPNWQGRLHVLEVEKSMVGQKVGITKKGEFAIKVR